MTLASLGMVLAAAVFHAIWNIAAKRHNGDSVVFVWLYVTLSALLCLPLALVQLARADWPWSWHLLVGPLIAAGLHLTYSLTLQTGYARAELGVVYPVARGTGPTVTMLVALVVLGERPAWVAVAGGLIVLMGIIVVAVQPRTGDSNGPSMATGVRYGVLTGLAIASYTLWDSHAVTSWELPPVTYFAITGAVQAIALAPGALRQRHRIRPVLRRNWREVGIVGVLSPAAYILVLIALQTTPVAIVAPVRESSIVIGSLLAWWLFREPNPIRRISGAAVVLLGVGMIATG